MIQRYKQQWALTEAGQALYQHAVVMLQKTTDIVDEIQEISHGTRGSLSIGVSSTCISYLPQTIQAFRVSYPNVYLKIWKGDSSYLKALLLEGTIEIALMLLPMELASYNFTRLLPEPFVIAVPKKWEGQITDEVVGLEQIVDYPFLMLAPMEGYTVYENIIQQFHKQNLSPNIIMACKDISTLLALVASGVGLSILPKSEIHEAFYHDIVTMEIKDFSLYVEPSMIWLKNHHLSKAADHFLTQAGNSLKTANGSDH